MSEKVELWNGTVASQPTGASWSALFSLGFRPFFLGASVYAVVATSVWIIWLMTQQPEWIAAGGSPVAWHAHEMVFGFGLAAVAGFLLTAVPNWTGALPLSGHPLAVLFAVWVAGRIAMMGAGAFPVVFIAVMDLAFVSYLTLLAGRQLLARMARRNFIFLVLLALLMIANALHHAAVAGLVSIDPVAPMRAGLLILVVMTTIVGGRIVPAFTHNWLHLNAPDETKPRRYAALDLVAVVSIALFALCEISSVPPVVLSAIAVVAALANGARLVLWRGWATWRAPILLILHVGYAWIVAGLALTGAASLSPEVSSSLALHAFGTGAVGTMVMAVMTRASLGHTGRALVAPRPIVWAYGLVTIAAVMRTFGIMLFPSLYMPFLMVAALSWIMAFALFVVVYAPILASPRLATGQPRA